MDSKKIIEKLIKIANNQQKIIEKLAQQVQPLSAPPVAQNSNISMDDAAVILAALPPAVKATVANLTTQGNQVMVAFHPGKDSDQAFNSVVQTVNTLQQNKKLRYNSSPYQVKSA